MQNFVAIDFETANQKRCSVCSVGIVLVKNGQVADKYYSLIRPEPNYYSYFCQQVHGLTPEDTERAPIFPAVWQAVETRISDVFGNKSMPFAAHNARFDESCLCAAFQVYQMDYPDYCFVDTLMASRKHFGRSLPNHKLPTVAAACGYDLSQHHHALADAEACATIAIKIIE